MSDADGDSSGDVPSGEDDTADSSNMLGLDEHFSKNNPRPLWVCFASGPDGQTARSRYPHEVIWTNAESILKLNRGAGRRSVGPTGNGGTSVSIAMLWLIVLLSTPSG